VVDVAQCPECGRTDEAIWITTHLRLPEEVRTALHNAVDVLRNGGRLPKGTIHTLVSFFGLGARKEDAGG
jgi:hypothetical protein